MLSLLGGEGSIIGGGASVFGIGSDIGGSIRMPCFFNGIFGHKPSKGRDFAVRTIRKTLIFPSFKKLILHIIKAKECLIFFFRCSVK